MEKEVAGVRVPYVGDFGSQQKVTQAGCMA